MGNLISKLLHADEPQFSLAIKQLERTSGHPGADVRLMSEIIQAVQLKIKELGLDVHDTTGEELYYALLGKIKTHDEHLAKHIGVREHMSAADMMPLIKKTLDKSDVPRSAWVIKKSVVKRLLHDMPPEKLMKHLGYSSVDSLMKRENVAEIFGALRFTEGPAWLRKFNKTYKQLQPSDFETRDIEIVVLAKERWGGLTDQLTTEKRYNITHLKEMGFVLLLPPKDEKVVGLTIATLPVALHYINEIRLYSAYFKLQQVRLDFGKTIARILNEDVHHTAELAGNKVHWRIVQRHYGRPEHMEHPEIFEPHVQPEDLYWRKAEEQLYIIDPELRFWRNLDYVGVMLGTDTPISFNLMDLSMSYYLATPYEERFVSHLRASLWNELFVRYMGQKVLEQQILHQLDGNLMNSDKIRLR